MLIIYWESFKVSKSEEKGQLLAFGVKRVFTVCSYIFLLLFGEICIFLRNNSKKPDCAGRKRLGQLGLREPRLAFFCAFRVFRGLRNATTEHTEYTEEFLSRRCRDGQRAQRRELNEKWEISNEKWKMRSYATSCKRFTKSRDESGSGSGLCWFS